MNTNATADFQDVTAKLTKMVNAVMLAYWGAATPAGFAKAWNHACGTLDRIAGGERVSYAKALDALKWLIEASKDDAKVAAQLAAA